MVRDVPERRRQQPRRSLRRPVLLAVALVLLAPTAHAKPPNASEVAARTELFDLINARRVAKTLTALREDAFVDREAYLHSKAMWRTSITSHAGYRRRVRNIEEHDPGYDVQCESVVAVLGVGGPNVAARRAYDLWRRSAPDRACMLHATANVAGIGVQRDGRGWWFTFVAVVDATR